MATNADSAKDKEAFLISVSEGYETNMVEGSLRSADIPYLKKGHGGPEGFSRFDTKYESLGVDFYVPSKLLVRAKSVLPPVEGANKIQDDLSKEGSGETDVQPQVASADNAANSEETPEGSPAKRMIGIILFLAVMAVVIFGVDAVMNIIRGLMGYK